MGTIKMSKLQIKKINKLSLAELIQLPTNTLYYVPKKQTKTQSCID